MSQFTKLRIGGDPASDLQEFVSAWQRAETGDAREERILAFESWEALAAVMTGERLRMLRHLHAHPERSVNALALALKRQYRRVHDDVRILENAGLLDRSEGEVRATADKLTTEVVF